MHQRRTLLLTLLSISTGMLLAIVLVWILNHGEARRALVGNDASAQAGLIISFTATFALLCFIVPFSWWAVEFIQALYFIRMHGWKIGWLKYKRYRCHHVWDKNSNVGIRKCEKCGYEEWSASGEYGGDFHWFAHNPDELDFSSLHRRRA